GRRQEAGGRRSQGKLTCFLSSFDVEFHLIPNSQFPIPNSQFPIPH
ncbi:MAG: hypothetical protein F6J86_25805, partial [Symploca sp. SIO1B1]|nr:hypothetical protein [Symploca sp. SIO1B1]